MKKLGLILSVLFLAALPARAQLGTIQGFCNNGGNHALTSGQPSSNYLQGTIPLCTVSVYYHDTTTPAPIFMGESSTGRLQSVQVTAGGSYSVCPTGVSFSGGGGSGATATVSCTSGAVVSVAVTNPGSGYTTAPSVSFTGGTGSGASATATIVGDLTNPFTANVDGSWRAWAAIATGYDITMSGGIPPNAYAQPRTITNIFPNAYGGTSYTIVQANGIASAPTSPVNFINSSQVNFSISGNQISAAVNSSAVLALQHEGVAVTDQSLMNWHNTPTNLSGGSLDAGYQPVAFKTDTIGGWAAETAGIQQSLQMATTPPTTGQYTIVYPTSFTQTHNCQGGSATNTSALLNIVGGVLGACEQTIVWAFSAPANIPAGNITAVYPFVTVAGGGTSYSVNQTSTAGGGTSPLINQFSNTCDYGGMHQCTSGSSISSPGTNITTLTVTADVATDNGYLAPGQSSSLNIPLVGAFVYYTGTPVPASTALNVTAPLSYNASTNSLGINLPFNALLDFGAVNAYQVVIPYAYPQPGTSIYVSTANANTSAAPTLLTTAQAGATQAWTIVGPRGLPLCSGDIANTSATGSFAHYVAGNDSKWYLQNPQACQYSGGTTLQVANAGTTGTTLNTLTKMTGAPSTAVISATTDTSGIVGVTVTGAGTTGTATIQLNGQANLVIDGATTAGDYVQISSTTAGNGHDAGATCPSSGQVVARVLSTNAAGGTYAVNLGPNGCGAGGGTTTNALTANSTGGAAPGSTFNGSAAVTWDYHSFGATGVSGTPTTGHCVDWASANTLGDTGSPCGSGSGGVTSLNTLTGALSLTSSDSSVTITPSGTSVNLQTAAAANGVQYNPSTTAYVFTGSSQNQDDGHSSSSAVAVSTWSCNGTVCTVTTSAAHNLSAGNWVDVSAMTGWFAAPANLGAQDSGIGTFQVLSAGLTSTQFEFNYSTNTGSGTGGNVYSANFWGPYYTVDNMPFFKGHGAVTWRFGHCKDIDTYFATKFGSVTGTPKYFIVANACANDFLTDGETVAQVEAHLQSIWAQAHTAGYIVVQTTTQPSSVGIPGSLWTDLEQLNYWMPSQAYNFFQTGGQYYDYLVDLNSYGTVNAISTLEGNGPTGAYHFAQRMNQAMASQSGSETAPPIMFSAGNEIDFWAGSTSAAYAWNFLDQNQASILKLNVNGATVGEGTLTAPTIVDTALGTSTLPICSNGSGGALTTTGCVTGGSGSGSQYCAIGGTSSAVTATCTPANTSYTANMQIVLLVTGSAIGAPATLNVDGLGAKTIQKLGQTLSAGDVPNGMDTFIYDGTNFELQNVVPVSIFGNFYGGSVGILTAPTSNEAILFGPSIATGGQNVVGIGYNSSVASNGMVAVGVNACYNTGTGSTNSTCLGATTMNNTPCSNCGAVGAGSGMSASGFTNAWVYGFSATVAASNTQVFGNASITDTYFGSTTGASVAHASHYLASGTPTIAAGTGAGTTPTVSIAGNDEGGKVTVTTGTTPTASAVVATVTLAHACPATIYPVISGAEVNSATLSGAGQVWAAGTAAGTWTINANTTALGTPITYVWNYRVTCN